jgi:signal transduction histidine kinase
MDDKDFCTSKLEIIISNIVRLDLMIEDVSDASRIKAGQTSELETREFDFKTTIEDIVSEAELVSE